FSLHSSTVNFGGGRRSSSSGSNSSSSCSVSEKSLMGEMSANVSFRPRSRNHLKESRWTATRSGSGSASSMFANEYRSRMRVDNESPLDGFGRHGRAGAPRSHGRPGVDRAVQRRAESTLEVDEAGPEAHGNQPC